MQGEAARIRSQTYWFLSGFFLQPPDGALLERLRASVGAGAAKEDPVFGPTLAELAGALEAESIQGLRVEYTRLLGGVKSGYGPPPPIESLHRVDRPPSDASEDVTRQYHEAGFGAIDPVAGPDDHLGVELKFMALLCLREAEAIEVGEHLQATRLVGLQSRFLDEHLLRWVPSYCARIAGEARHAYFVAVARLTASACLRDRDYLRGPSAAPPE